MPYNFIQKRLNIESLKGCRTTPLTGLMVVVVMVFVFFGLFFGAGIKLRALCLLGKRSTT